MFCRLDFLKKVIKRGRERERETSVYVRENLQNLAPEESIRRGGGLSILPPPPPTPSLVALFTLFFQFSWALCTVVSLINHISAEKRAEHFFAQLDSQAKRRTEGKQASGEQEVPHTFSTSDRPSALLADPPKLTKINF